LQAGEDFIRVTHVLTRCGKKQCNTMFRDRIIPRSHHPMSTSNPVETGRKLAKIGAWMQLAILAGMAGTAIGMMHAFETLGTSGVGDPGELSKAIGEVLWSTAAGIGVAMIGALLTCISILGMRYRAAWLFWFLILDGIAWTATLPPLGLFFIMFALIKRHEFFPERLDKSASPA
jgi:hypothetical protein